MNLPGKLSVSFFFCCLFCQESNRDWSQLSIKGQSWDTLVLYKPVTLPRKQETGEFASSLNREESVTKKKKVSGRASESLPLHCNYGIGDAQQHQVVTGLEQYHLSELLRKALDAERAAGLGHTGTEDRALTCAFPECRRAQPTPLYCTSPAGLLASSLTLRSPCHEHQQRGGQGEESLLRALEPQGWDIMGGGGGGQSNK